MKRMILLSVAIASGLLSTSVLAQDSRPPTAAEAGWREIANCARIGSAQARHECLDDVIRRAGLLDPSLEEEARRAAFGSTATPRDRPEERASTNVVSAAPPQAEAPAQSSKPAREDRLSTMVRTARLAGNRRLIVVTADGAIWEQTESETMRVLPDPGDRFEIQRNALGGYRCKFERSSVYRCRRAN